MDDHYHTPWQPVATFQNVSRGPISAEAGPGGYGEWQKVTPVGRLSRSDVTVALLDSTIVFGLVSVPLGLICYMSAIPWLVGPFTGFCLASIRYLYAMANTQGLLTVRESWKAGDPKPAEPGQAQEQVVTVQIKESKRWQYAYLKIAPEKLAAFAEAILGGAGMTEREAKKYGITQEELNHLRTEFINRGLAYWNDPSRKQQGVTLRHSGYTVLKAILDSTQQHAAGGDDE